MVQIRQRFIRDRNQDKRLQKDKEENCLPPCKQGIKHQDRMRGEREKDKEGSQGSPVEL